MEKSWKMGGGREEIRVEGERIGERGMGVRREGVEES